MPLNVADFEFVRALVTKRSAIVLDAEKTYLVESRLVPVAKSVGLATTSDLVAHLRSSPLSGLHQKVVEAMTTNETSFFRDLHPFEAFKNVVVPDMLKRRASTRQLRIWCGASSTGQEPFSLAMLLREDFPCLKNWSVRIIATDLSDHVLERARRATFSQLEVNRGLPAPYLVKYFERRGLEWRLKDEICSMVEFGKLNLIESWPAMPPLDVVFLRNVLIYFDVPTKKQILAKIRAAMRSDGYFFLGGAETTLNLDENFERIDFDRSGCYTLKGK
jgi:chemotaxis protein methyltransferase CheR